jgi:ABC-type multidrug transport system fused ATPase/permease subunit
MSASPPIRRRLWETIGPALRPYHGRLGFALALLVVQVAMSVLEPLPLKVVIDNVLRHRPLSVPGLGGDWLRTLAPAALLAWSCVVLLALALVGGALEYCANARIAEIGQRAVLDLRHALFYQIEGLALSQHQERSSGELVHRLTSDVASLQEMLISILTVLLANALTIAGVLFVMIRIDAVFALVAVGTCLPLFLLTRRYAGRMKAASRRARAGEGEIAALVQEVLSSIRIVKAFAREDHEAARFGERNRRSGEAGRVSIRLQARFKPLVDLLIAVGTVMVVYVGIHRALAGRLTIGEVVLFLTYQKALYSPVRQLAKLAGVIAKGSIAVERLGALMAVPACAASSGRERIEVAGAVSFDRVSFGYGARTGGVLDGSQVLRDVSFEARAGQTIALVGSTGAGKSTLVSLIPRFYEPTQGALRIDGRDVRRLDVDCLRRQIGIVLQEPVLFRATVWENIAYGLPEAPSGFGPAWLAELDETGQRALLARVEQAARDANAHEFITRLPRGYHTILGERGEDLSGGQRQRIAIARAMARRAPILILDEPTSGLDAESEALVMQALERLMHGRTTFVIAHRLSTVRRAALILVLETGRIVEAGSHAELYQRGGRYRALCDLQFLPELAPRPRSEEPRRAWP